MFTSFDSQHSLAFKQKCLVEKLPPLKRSTETFLGYNHQPQNLPLLALTEYTKRDFAWLGVRDIDSEALKN